MSTPPNNVGKTIQAATGLATLLIGVVGMVYNDRIASGGIITAGIGILAHTFT